MILDVRFCGGRQGCERLHSHNYSVVAAVEGGVMEMRIAGVEVRIKKGDLCVIPAGVTHQTLGTSRDFSGVYVVSISSTVSDLKGLKASGGMVVDDGELYGAFIEWMGNDYWREGLKGADGWSRLRGIFASGGIVLESTADSGELKASYWVPERIKELIDGGVESGECFEYIEGRLPFSKEHCNRLFKKSYGITIQGYSLNVRAERARVLLKGELPLAEVAAQAGFYDQSQLSRAFKSIFQITPGDYRKQLQGDGRVEKS